MKPPAKVVLTGLTAALLAFSFYLGIICLVGMTLHYLYSAITGKNRWKQTLMWIGAMFISLLIFLPWLTRLLGQAGRQLGFVGWDNLITHLKMIPVAGNFKIFWFLDATHFLPDNTALRAIWFVAWSALALLGLVRLFGKPLVRLWFAAWVFTILTNWTLMLCFQLYYLPKYHFMFAPLYYLCVAAGIDYVFSGSRVRSIVLGVLLAAVPLAVFYRTADMWPDNRDTIEYLNRNVTAQDVIILNPPYQSTLFTTFYDGDAEILQLPEEYDPRKPYVTMPHVDDDRIARLGAQTIDAGTLYFFYGLGVHTRVDPDAKILQWLENNYYVIERKKFYIGYPASSPLGLLIIARPWKPVGN